MLFQAELGLHLDLQMFLLKCDFFLTCIEFLDISKNKNAETCMWVQFVSLVKFFF